MTIMRHLPDSLGLAGLVLASCASYEPSSAVVPTLPELDQSVTAQGLTVAAKPIADAKDQAAYFDADFSQAGVVAIQVLTRNGDGKPYLIRPSDVVLVTPDGTRYRAAGVTSVVDKVGESGSVVGATLAFGIIGFLAAADAEDEARASRRADYRSKSFAQTTLRPGEEASGTVFFIPPDGTPPFDVGTLGIRFIDVGAGESTVIELPLTGLGFSPPAKEPTQGR